MQTITKTYEVFPFKELSKEVQKRVISTRRDINIHDEWSQEVIENWKEKLQVMGFFSPTIYFRGFGSQGDGACFDAIPDLVMLAKYLGIETGEVESSIYNHSLSGEIVKVGSSNIYSHENTRDFQLLLDEALSPALLSFEEKGEELRERVCKEIYKELEEEYDGLTSDEAIIDTLEVNEYLFLKDGTLFTE